MGDKSISDISVFLSRYGRAGLDDLRTRFPDQAAFFESEGVSLGDDDNGPREAAAWSMLESIAAVADKAQKEVSARLRAARWLEGAGALLSLASSAGVVAALNIESLKAGTIGFALLAFAGSAVPLVVNRLRGSGNVASSAESLGKLRDLVWTGQLLQARLKRD